MMTLTPIFKAYIQAQINGTQVPLGVVAHNDKKSEYVFAYAESWLTLDGAYAIDPLHLPLSTKRYHSPKMFDCLLDSGPDNWGRRVMAATHSQLPRGPIEELIACRGTGAGNLLFSASRTRSLDPKPIPSFDDLQVLIEGAAAVQRRELVEDERLKKLLDYGSSMGGARPKLVVSSEGREWIAKLNRTDDTFDNAKAEWSCFELARMLGLTVPETQFHTVKGHSVLLVERFDRDAQGGRLHYISAQALLGMHRVKESDFAKLYSYAGIAAQMRKSISEPWKDMSELYKRMILNVHLHNTDDHLRNHGFILDPNNVRAGYRLSPIFDIVPHEGSDNHAIGIGTSGRESSIQNALSHASYFGLNEARAMEIVDQVADALTHFSSIAESVEMGGADIKRLTSIMRR